MDAPGVTNPFDPLFLGVEAPLPVPGAASRVRALPSTHFTVLLDLDRRLAAATAVNILGSALRDVDRGDNWHLDPRVAPTEQCGPELYSRNDLDRGHLVRRRDPVWGDEATALRANAETFAYPNAAPQAAEFNQSAELWSGLEDYLLEHARAGGQRLSVFTGPVLDPGDPLYRGVQIPQMYWKVAAWNDTTLGLGGAAGRLATTGYVLDQRPQLDEIELRVAIERALADDRPPPLGPFRTFQVPVGDIAGRTGLKLGPMVGADRLVARPTPEGQAPTSPGGWVRLRTIADARL